MRDRTRERNKDKDKGRGEKKEGERTQKEVCVCVCGHERERARDRVRERVKIGGLQKTEKVRNQAKTRKKENDINEVIAPLLWAGAGGGGEEGTLACALSPRLPFTVALALRLACQGSYQRVSRFMLS